MPISNQNNYEVCEIYDDSILSGLATFETKIPDRNNCSRAHLPFARITLINKKHTWLGSIKGCFKRKCV